VKKSEPFVCSVAASTGGGGPLDAPYETK